jgi:hypothetical protein
VAFGRRIQRTRAGEVRLRLPREEQEVLRVLGAELASRLEDPHDDPTLRRLFPPAYSDDEEGDADYRRLVGDQLLDGRRRALATLEATVGRDRLTDAEAQAWLTALNDARLVIGTRLDVTEEMDFTTVRPEDPEARDVSLYLYLTWLQEQLVEAIAG